jgi:hypothetical protein
MMWGHAMPGSRTCKSPIRTPLILLTLGGAADAVALLILPAALNGNEVLPGSTSGANEMSFIARFHPLQFDVLVESNDDPFSPIALTGLPMTRGGDAPPTGIGDAMSTTLVYAFSRSTVAEFSFGPSFAANASGLMGGSMPDS